MFNSNSSQLLLIALAALGLSACANLSVPTASVLSPLAGVESRYKSITGFDVYRDQQRIHAVFTASPKQGAGTQIAYLYSDDNGLSWSPVQQIEPALQGVIESKQGNDIQIAAVGQQLMISWQTRGEIPGMGPLRVMSSSDGGQHWRQALNPTASEIDQSHHDLAADSLGRFHVVWLDDRDENGYQGLRYAQTDDLGQHWQAQQSLDDSSCSCCWNRLIGNADGQLHVLYRDMAFRDMALMQSTNRGQSWQRLSTVGSFNWKFDGCPHNGGGLSQSDTETLHALVWTGAEQQAGLYYLRSADLGKNWTQPHAVAPGTGAFHADIAALDAEQIAMVWDAMGPNGSRVLWSLSADHGVSWSEGAVLSLPDILASHPRLLATESGWLAFWTEQHSDKTKHWRSAVIQ